MSGYYAEKVQFFPTFTQRHPSVSNEKTSNLNILNLSPFTSCTFKVIFVIFGGIFFPSIYTHGVCFNNKSQAAGWYMYI